MIQSEKTTQDQEKKEYYRLLSKAMDLLAKREHGVTELTNKLQARTDSRDLVHTVIDELLKKNLVSDERFTEAYVRSRRNKGFGPIKIHHELQQKGVAEVLIEEYLHPEEAAWYESAEIQYNKKYREQPITDYNTWSKRARFLQSRGFAMEQIRTTLGEFNN